MSALLILPQSIAHAFHEARQSRRARFDVEVAFRVQYLSPADKCSKRFTEYDYHYDRGGFSDNVIGLHHRCSICRRFLDIQVHALA